MQEDARKNNDNTGNFDHLFHTIYCNMSTSQFLTKFVYVMWVDSISYKKESHSCHIRTIMIKINLHIHTVAREDNFEIKT